MIAATLDDKARLKLAPDLEKQTIADGLRILHFSPPLTADPDRGVIGLILTQRDCVIIPVQFQHMLGRFGQHITVKDWDAQITGTAQISVVCIGNHNRHIQITQKCPKLRTQTGAPNDQNTGRIPAR